MKASVNKRLSWIELVLAQQDVPDAVVIDFSVFSDEELDRLELLAERFHAWTGDDWFHEDLSPEEQDQFLLLAEKASCGN